MKEYRFRINGNEYEVVINSVSAKTADVTVNGKSYLIDMEDIQAPVSQEVHQKSETQVMESAAMPEQARTVTSSMPSAASRTITSPLPGVILSINVKVGDTVIPGQEIAVLEAMKMENSIESTTSGTVTSIHVSKGDTVKEGVVLITIG